MRTSLRIIFGITTMLVLAFANANESRTKQDLDAVQKELEKSQKSYQGRQEGKKEYSEFRKETCKVGD